MQECAKAIPYNLSLIAAMIGAEKQHNGMKIYEIAYMDMHYTRMYGCKMKQPAHFLARLKVLSTFEPL